MTTEAKSVTPPRAVDRSTPDEVIAAQRNRQIVILTAVIVVLAGLVALTRFTRGADVKADPAPLVPGTADNPAFKRENVGQIEIRRGTDQPLILRRDESKGWRIPARFNAPADNHDIDMLLNKVFESKRLGRPSTEDTSRYSLYSLADDEAVQLRLCDSEGRELLKLLVGKGEDGSRDFIRLTGADAPAGIFEIANSTGTWDSLYSRMNLDTESRPDAKRWLDLSGFKIVPAGGRVTGITVEDAGRVLEFRQNATDEKKWDVLKPGRFEGETTAIQGIVSTLDGLSAADIAGQDTDAAALGIADSKRKVVLDYTYENKPEKALLSFGNVKDNQVAVHLKMATQGSMIYWVGDHVLGRIFRKLTEFAAPADVSLVPPGRKAERIRAVDGDKLMEAEERTNAQGIKEWTLVKPVEGKADRMAISTLTNRLNTLRGAKTLEKPDFVALGVDPSVTTKLIELTWTEPGEKKEGEEKPAEIRKTAALYFGTTENEQTPILKRVTGQEDQFFWLAADVVADMFAEPSSYHFYEVKVRQILITWKGKYEGLAPKVADRTEEQARKLVADLTKRANDGEDFVKLQLEFNEDGTPDTVYDVNPGVNFVEPFKKLAASLPIGGIGSCDSQFGVHILKRVE